MKTEHIVKALEEVVQQFGLEVRWEKGRFQGGRCTVRGEDLILLNKHHPAEVHLAILAESLHDLPMDTVFLRPAVREAVEAIWKRHPKTLHDALLEDEDANVS